MANNVSYKTGSLVKYSKEFQDIADSLNLLDDFALVLDGAPDTNRSIRLWWCRSGKEISIVVERPDNPRVFEYLVE